LSLEIAFVDGVVVHDADAPDARGSEVLEHRRSEAARSDAKHSRCGETFLPADAYLRNEQMPAVPANTRDQRGCR
jgi:hypothetical protein